MGLDINIFYTERNAIFNQPDEDLNDYCRRILSRNTESQPNFGFAPFLEEEDMVSLYSDVMNQQRPQENKLQLHRHPPVNNQV